MQTSSLPALPNFTPEESKVLEIKYAALPFGKMTDAELFAKAHTLLLQIHVITGWVVPHEEIEIKGQRERFSTLDVLLQQFMLKLKESYSNVNEEEILYAFRNAQGVEDWGKKMNLNLIDVVMRPYLQSRLEASKIEESKAFQLEKPTTPPVTDEEFVEAAFRMFLLHRNFLEIPLQTYQILKDQLDLTEENKQKIRSIITEKYGQENSLLCKLYAVAEYFTKKENDDKSRNSETSE